MVTERNSSTNDTRSGTSSGRQRATEAFEGARKRTADRLSEAPVLALAGGLAAGALVAVLFPATDAETRFVSPTARRVRDSARVALDAARKTGSEKLDELGINRQKGEEAVRNLFSGLTDAARASADAAIGAVRNQG